MGVEGKLKVNQSQLRGGSWGRFQEKPHLLNWPGEEGGGQSNTQSGDTQCNLMTFKSDLRPQMLRTSVTTSKQKEHRIYKRSTQNKISKKYICENLPTISSLASVGSGINLCLMPRNPRNLEGIHNFSVLVSFRWFVEWKCEVHMYVL